MTLDLESRVAVVESRLDELGRAIDSVVPMIAAVARVEEKVNTLTKNVEEDRASASSERKSFRNAFLVLAGSIGAALISGAALLLAAPN